MGVAQPPTICAQTFSKINLIVRRIERVTYIVNIQMSFVFVCDREARLTVYTVNQIPDLNLVRSVPH